MIKESEERIRNEIEQKYKNQIGELEKRSNCLDKSL